jgi:predicted ester cyclase
VGQDALDVARRFMSSYADGDPEALLACLAPGWVVHERDGSTSTAADLAEITRVHAAGFPEKRIDYLHELEQGDRVAQFVKFTLVHTAEYAGLAPTGREVDLFEMIFHQFEGGLIAESWRMTYPDSVRAALASDPAP